MLIITQHNIITPTNIITQHPNHLQEKYKLKLKKTKPSENSS